jgi:hypothetical protein
MLLKQVTFPHLNLQNDSVSKLIKFVILIDFILILSFLKSLLTRFTRKNLFNDGLKKNRIDVAIILIQDLIFCDEVINIV